MHQYLCVGRKSRQDIHQHLEFPGQSQPKVRCNFRNLARKSKDLLARYQDGEIARLLEDRGRIRAFDFDLTLKVLDHMEMTADVKLAVVFLDGTKIMV